MRRLRAESGFSLIEVLISSTISLIVMLGVFDLYVSSAKSTLGQGDIIDMQMQVKAAMDLMVREMRLMNAASGVSPTITSTLTANDTVTFRRVESSGFSSGGNAANTLRDTTQNWTANAFAPSANGSYYVYIVTGTSAGEIHSIGSNTAFSVTLTDTWTRIPDTSSLYYIVRNKTFTRTADNTLRYQSGSGLFNPIALNITSLMFSQPDPASITITVTGRTSSPDPRTGNYTYLTLTDTVRSRT